MLRMTSSLVPPEIARLLDILGKQNADGSFPLTKAVAKYCGENMGTLKKMVGEFEGVEREDAQKMVATVWVLRKILKEVPSAKDLWEPGVKKALEWLRKISDTHSFEEVDRLIGEIEKEVKG